MTVMMAKSCFKPEAAAGLYVCPSFFFILTAHGFMFMAMGFADKWTFLFLFLQ